MHKILPNNLFRSNLHLQLCLYNVDHLTIFDNYVIVNNWLMCLCICYFKGHNIHLKIQSVMTDVLSAVSITALVITIVVFLTIP